ncbi:DUF3857 domain-containing protein [Candidatus Tisiphia endosymbiont of Beris chalybata]|uniref:DUF3857 domain-containing protein n=1 Tax=Candidatus Tisiphia endosymbiont of Beris chalybata TaxID=3066262 RepID=UPI00312C8089
MQRLKILFTLALLLLYTISPVEARWGKYEDAAVEIKFFNNKIKVNKNGTSEIITEFKATILKETARSSFSQYSFTYNGDSSYITILEAKTIYNGKEYLVTKDMIEDKPLASGGQGFDQLKQLVLSFPKVELGATIYLKYKQVETKVPIDNFYGHNLFYGGGGYWQASSTKITSELPLKLKINDPKNVLKVVQETKKNTDSINITLTAPIYEGLVNEPSNGILNIKHATWVSVSSLLDWQEFAKKLTPGYYKVINQPLPEIFTTIADSAAKKNNDEEKINFVTSSLNEKIQYMGDWRSIAGRYFPRDLEKIANSQIGDCKDFTASTASILQKLGYQVQPILVMRGTYNISNPGSLPNISNFNHVMLKVTSPEQKVYWIDPTNIVSMAQGIFPDISNKDGLMLDAKEAGYVKIPAISEQSSKTTYNSELIIQNNVIDETGQAVMHGETALDFAGAGLYYSNEQLRDMTFYLISGVHLNEEDKKSLELPDLTSRIVKDLTIKYKFQQKNLLFNTNNGPALRLGGSSAVKHIISTAPDQLSDIFIGIPGTNEKHIQIRNTTIKHCERLDFKIDSPWLSINRFCKYQDQGTEFIDKVIIRKSFITNEELKTTEYKNLKEQLENNFDGASIIINE